MRYFSLILSLFFLPFISYAVVGPITGTPVVCQFATTALSDTTAGGTWSSSTTSVATVSSGIVSGVSAGTSTITYTAGLSYVTITVTVNPQPILTSTLTPPAICDSSYFNYTPTSIPPGALFSWERAYVPGILLLAGSGIDNPVEQLINYTNFPVAVTYTYTLTANGCTNTANVTVTVNPTPVLSSQLTPSVCDSTLFSYYPASGTPGTTFSWTRNLKAGISNPTSSGSGNILETLDDTTTSPVMVTYYFTLKANGCMNHENVFLTVKPCGVSVPQNNLLESNIYPNPNDGTFSVYIPSAANERVALTITNMLGEKVKEIITATNITTVVNLDVSAGIYFLSSTIGQHIYYSKIIVANK